MRGVRARDMLRRPMRPKEIILACALSLVVAFVAACGGQGDDPPVPAGDGSAPAASAARTDALPRLLDLGADKCVPCKAMAPILEEMRDTFEGKLRVEFVDVWKDRSAAEQYGVKVIPTQIFFDPEGNELFRHQGFFSREDMLAKWREFGYGFEG